MRSGIVAELPSADALERAHDRLLALGYTRIGSWTPYPLRKVLERLPESKVAWIVFGAGLFGATFGYIVQWWCSARDYPIDVGGRPLHSVPAFVPIAFESAVLFASVTGFVLMLGFSGLPRLYHPLFDVEGFESASIDRFWIGVDDGDPRFDGESVRLELERLGARRFARIGGAR